MNSPAIDALTDSQLAVLDAITCHIKDHGYPPSIREVGEVCGMSSSSTVHSHMKSLERLGFIERDLTKPRAIKVHGVHTTEWLAGYEHGAAETTADRDFLQAELDEIRSMGTHRKPIDGECQCFSCTRDWHAMTDYASSLDMDLQEALAELVRYRQALAKIDPWTAGTTEDGRALCVCGGTMTYVKGQGWVDLNHADDCVWLEAHNKENTP